ncbi:MAG TPA: DUF3471 domain-containing protein [Blastocatellia bacterium]|nr:DUF3471 domain-containing protein [Blastocatellia bacterium]
MRKSLSFLFAAAFLAAVCFIFSPASSASGGDDAKGAKAITFSKDVAPIFYKNCVACHRPDDLAPMSLMSYKEARPWARSIKEKVITRQMPPWHADPHFGQFANDKRLSEQEINTIVAWVDGGAKEGDSRELPPAPNFNDQWQIGTPDLVLSMSEEYTIAAQGSDEYIRFVIPTNFKEYTWVKAVEIHPGNKKVVHHAVAFVQTPAMIAGAKANPQGASQSGDQASIFYKDGTLVRTKPDAPSYDDGCNAPDGGFARGSGQEALGPLLGFYAPGKDVDVWPAGSAKGIAAGSNIILEMHYSKTTGKVERDRTTVGLVFSKEPPEKIILSNGALNHYFKIPAGADNHEVKACYNFGRDTYVHTLMPHMHKRGKDMKYEVIYPDGRRETLLAVPRYNFSWQYMYRLKEPLLIPKGSKMIVTAHYDNSERNKNNPDPTKVVRWGDPTYDEMMIGYMDYVVKVPARTAMKIDPKILDAYVGEYEVLPGRTMVITREGGNLLVSSRGLPGAPVYPESETKFFFKVTDVQITFVKDEKGEVNELVIDQGGRMFRAKKAKKPAQVKEN